MMDSVLGECYDCSATYIDDIIVFSEDWASHLVDLRKVLGVLGKHGLTAKLVKCSWGEVLCAVSRAHDWRWQDGGSIDEG